jgi:AcrR family transcriptional regulator
MTDDPLKPARTGRIGRPRSEFASAHESILDAVHALLQETSIRDLTMEAVARRAGVGKPTLYKWWPSKAALVFAMFHERMERELEAPEAATLEARIRFRVRGLLAQFRDLFGKVMAELIAEGQSEPAVLRELYDQHIHLRRSQIVADIELAKSGGELRADTDPEILVDAIFGPLYYRMLLRITPLDEAYGDRLVDQVFRGVRAAPGRWRGRSPNSASLRSTPAPDST